MLSRTDLINPNNYPVQHGDDVFGVMKAADVLVVSSIDDGHGLQAEALHLDLGRQQEPVVEVVEEDGRLRDRGLVFLRLEKCKNTWP